MSKAVACKKVEGFEKFIAPARRRPHQRGQAHRLLPAAPLQGRAGQEAEAGHRYRAKFSQDGRIRRKGEKTVLMKKDQLLEYEPFFETPTERIYLVNTIGLKGLPPGDYEFDIILHDGLDEGSTSTQSVPFTIIPTPKVDAAPESRRAGRTRRSARPRPRRRSEEDRPRRLLDQLVGLVAAGIGGLSAGGSLSGFGGRPWLSRTGRIVVVRCRARRPSGSVCLDVGVHLLADVERDRPVLGEGVDHLEDPGVDPLGVVAGQALLGDDVGLDLERGRGRS